MSETRVMTAHVPQGLAEQIDQMAITLDRSRGWIVRQALADFVAREERRHHMTLEALADVDARRGVDHEAVESWIDSLGTNRPASPPKCV